jgi:hypothetical protein
MQEDTDEENRPLLKRVHETMGKEKSSGNFLHDNYYYFEDGSVVFLVDNVLFKVCGSCVKVF